jgi:hypothetical protein
MVTGLVNTKPMAEGKTAVDTECTKHYLASATTRQRQWNDMRDLGGFQIRLVENNSTIRSTE